MHSITLGTTPTGLQFTLFGRSRLLVADTRGPHVFAYQCRAPGTLFLPIAEDEDDADADADDLDAPFARVALVRKQVRHTDVSPSPNHTSYETFTIYALTHETSEKEARCCVYKFRMQPQV